MLPMKDLLIQMAKYNIWANRRFAEVMLKLSEGQLDQEIASSFPSIRQTVYHMWSAEQIWLERLLLKENPIWAEVGFTGTFATACEHWLEVSEGLLDFASKQFDDRGFDHVTEYYDRKKQTHKTPVKIILQQVFNHATYHRGQLTTMLRQVGAKQIPQTDLVIFTRERS
jgi:uncharacterized damage-inducible protein DinB